jgi:hypothetical protein
MQNAGRKTPEKAKDAKILEGSKVKPLVSTLFMMFNSRYRGKTVNRINCPPSSHTKDWSNVLYFKGGECY